MAEAFIVPPPRVEETLKNLGVQPPKKKNNLLLIVLIVGIVVIGGGIIYLTSQLGTFRGDNRQRAYDVSNKACGEPCSSDSDCRTTGANGGPVGCRAGICENLACPTGKTIYGANCDCSVAARSCGQTCGASVGLCGDGKSTCRFLTGLTCRGNEFNNATVCVPNTLPTGWALAKCNNQPNGNSYALKNGANPTQADVQTICEPVRTTCYRCTTGLDDGNACESFTISDPTCPASSSATINACATAIGGACPTPLPTPTPATCNSTCSAQVGCASGLTCTNGSCRNPSCTDQIGCTCPTATPTPTATKTPTATPTKLAATATPIPTALPDAGFELPTSTVFGGGMLLLILGIVLSL